MPRERRYTEDNPEIECKTKADFVNFYEKTQTMVNFLTYVYDGNIQMVAEILCAQAEGDKDTIKKYLNAIHKQCEKWLDMLDELKE